MEQLKREEEQRLESNDPHAQSLEPDEKHTAVACCCHDAAGAVGKTKKKKTATALTMPGAVKVRAKNLGKTPEVCTELERWILQLRIDLGHWQVEHQSVAPVGCNTFVLMFHLAAAAV